jgi:predicted homoserine dehydrogenase-like protein
MGRAIARQLVERAAGIELVGIANRTVERAAEAFREAGVSDVVEVGAAEELERARRARQPVITGDASLLAAAAGVDVVVEATGTVEHGARVALHAIVHGKHVVLCNAELGGTLGPVLARYATDAGVVLTDIDGDQPGAQANLHRFVRGIGLTPVLCGSVKGLLDRSRTPETQQGFAARWGQTPSMVTSFADGTKLAFEQAVVGNALGYGVLRRGMTGRRYDGLVDDPEHLALWDAEELRRAGGVVDYTLGARPPAGVFVLAVEDDPGRRRHLDLLKLGEGPLYCFTTPFHLCSFEVPFTVARAALFGDATVTPARHAVEVVAAAKRDLVAGETLDGIGWTATYGLCENAQAARRDGLLPMGIAEGCTVARDVAQHEVLAYADVELPQGRLCDRLRREQDALAA